MGIRRFSMLFRHMLSVMTREEDPDVQAEWSDAVSLMAAGFNRGGPDAALYTTAATIESFIRAAEADDGTVDHVPEKIREVNRRILRTVRNHLDADERALVDLMVKDHHEEIAEWIREERERSS